MSDYIDLKNNEHEIGEVELRMLAMDMINSFINSNRFEIDNMVSLAAFDREYRYTFTNMQGKKLTCTIKMNFGYD